MFLTDTDYRVVVGENAFRTITQASPLIIQHAESEAIEEVAGYLRPNYDVEAIFSATDSQRNPQIVMITADVALYHMVSSLPNRLGYEIREARYKRAISWLEGVAAGKIVPDLPTPAADCADEGSAPAKVAWHSAWKRDNQW